MKLQKFFSLKHQLELFDILYETFAISQSNATMGVTKTILQEGSGPEAAKGDKVSMHYTGWLKDASQPDGRGKK